MRPVDIVILSMIEGTIGYARLSLRLGRLVLTGRAEK